LVLESTLVHLAPDRHAVRSAGVDGRVGVGGREVPGILVVGPAEIGSVGGRQESPEPEVNQVVGLELGDRVENANPADVAVSKDEIALELEEGKNLPGDVRPNVQLYYSDRVGDRAARSLSGIAAARPKPYAVAQRFVTRRLRCPRENRYRRCQ